MPANLFVHGLALAGTIWIENWIENHEHKWVSSNLNLFVGFAPAG
jgi:hypothetical protein